MRLPKREDTTGVFGYVDIRWCMDPACCTRGSSELLRLVLGRKGGEEKEWRKGGGRNEGMEVLLECHKSHLTSPFSPSPLLSQILMLLPEPNPNPGPRARVTASWTEQHYLYLFGGSLDGIHPFLLFHAPTKAPLIPSLSLHLPLISLHSPLSLPPPLCQALPLFFFCTNI